ncbi:MAG TPA: tetratricopeptide repeat protein [Vicinamibacteria bacterium]|nr:tetratricopeptide repeat protein [Vicinamibacteria bacterium]
MKQVHCLLVSLLAASVPLMAQSKIDQAVQKAEEQIAKGKPEDAVKTVSKVVDQNPTSAEAHLALARVHALLGNLDEVAAVLAKAKDATSGAEKAAVLAAIAAQSLSTGSGKDALAHAQQAVELAAAPVTLAALARAQARMLDASSALQTADKAVAAGATSARAHEARGEALQALGRDADAEAAYRKALELDPKLTMARERLAAILISTGKAADAVVEARKAVEADPKNAEAFATLGRALLAANPKDWSSAISEAQQGAFLNPKSPYVQLSVGKIFEAAGNFDQASAAYQRALESDPDFGPARLALLQSDIARGKAGTTIPDLKKLAESMPGSGEAQLLVGEQMLRKNEFTESVPILEKAAKLLPGSSLAWALLGQAYQFNRRSDEAAVAFRKAVELAPTNTSYRTTLGILLGIAGKHDEGVAELRKVVATPGYKEAAAWVNLGWIYRNMKPPRTEDSIAAYKKALEIDPKEEQSALGLGWAYSYTKSWDEAIAAFNRAIQIEPKFAGEAYNGIAWCYFFKRELPRSREFMEKAQAEGRTDTRLAENIDRLEKAIAAGQAITEEEIRRAEEERERERERYAKFEEANTNVRSRNAVNRIRGCRDLAALAGGEAVPVLVHLMQNDSDYAVREACTIALGSLGAGARSALPNLRAMLNHACDESLTMTKEQMEAALKCEDFRRAARDAFQRVNR